MILSHIQYDIGPKYVPYELSLCKQFDIEILEQYIPPLVKYLQKNGIHIDEDENFKLLTAFPSKEEKNIMMIRLKT